MPLQIEAYHKAEDFPPPYGQLADSLLKWLSKRGVYAQGYADDGVVLVIGIVLSTICEIIQRAVKGIEE